MALPADVAFSVGAQIHAYDVGRRFGILAMALSAEFAGLRLGGSAEQRRDLVLFFYLVAGGAGNGGVLGESFGSGNLAVAGAALLRRVRRHWRVGIVTGDTRPPWVVADGINLREAGRPRGVVGMTERAKGPLTRGGRYVIPGRFDVSRLSAVADLAGHGAVVGVVVCFDNVGMAHRASFVSRIDERLGGIGVNRGGPVMAQGAERLGNEVMPCTNQTAHQDQEDDGQAVQLLRHSLGPTLAASRGAGLEPLPVAESPPSTAHESFQLTFPTV